MLCFQVHCLSEDLLLKCTTFPVYEDALRFKANVEKFNDNSSFNTSKYWGTALSLVLSCGKCQCDNEFNV